jgi:inosine/xanthosine triphosphatase
VQRVRVGTTNEPKLEGVRSALAPYAPAARVEGGAVESGVPEQPLGFDAIVLGARNRASRAASMNCELSIGIEDGLVALPTGSGRLQHVNLGCAAVLRGDEFSLGFSSGFAYPPACVMPVLDGSGEIGPVFDRFWLEHRGEELPLGSDGRELPSGRSVGNIGKLSGGVLPRSEYARHAVVCALLPLLHPDLYSQDGSSRPQESVE